jgi:hypothetical protein
MILGMMGLLATRAFMQASLSSVPPHLPLSRALSQLAAGGEVGNQVGNQGHPQPSAVASATPSAAGSAAVHEGSESQDGQPDAKTFAQGQGLDTPAAEPQGLAFHSAYASPPGSLSRVEGLGDGVRGSNCACYCLHVWLCVSGVCECDTRKKDRDALTNIAK